MDYKKLTLNELMEKIKADNKNDNVNSAKIDIIKSVLDRDDLFYSFFKNSKTNNMYTASGYINKNDVSKIKNNLNIEEDSSFDVIALNQMIRDITLENFVYLTKSAIEEKEAYQNILNSENFEDILDNIYPALLVIYSDELKSNKLAFCTVEEFLDIVEESGECSDIHDTVKNVIKSKVEKIYKQLYDFELLQESMHMISTFMNIDTDDIEEDDSLDLKKLRLIELFSILTKSEKEFLFMLTSKNKINIHDTIIVLSYILEVVTSIYMQEVSNQGKDIADRIGFPSPGNKI